MVAMNTLKRLDKIVALVVLALTFSVSAKAQADCSYGFEIYVRDGAGKRIEKAKLEASGLTDKDILPADVKPFLNYRGAYLMAGDAGQTVNGNFLLRVSADGFETYERKFNFPECEFQIFELKLQPKGSTAKASFERLYKLHGTVYDEASKPFGDAKIEATFADGRVYQATSNAYGYYEMNVPQGVANIRVTNSRIPDIAFDKFEVEEDNTVLNVAVCLKCKQGGRENKNFKENNDRTRQSDIRYRQARCGAKWQGGSDYSTPHRQWIPCSRAEVDSDDARRGRRILCCAP